MSADHENRGARALSRGELTAVFAFWTFIAMLGAATRLLDPREAGSPSPGFAQAVTIELFEAWIWAAFTPLIFWVVHRLRLSRTHWVRPALGLAALGLATAVFVDVTEDLFRSFVFATPPGPGTSATRSVLRMWFLNDLLIFAGVVAAGLARAYFLRYRDRREEAIRLQAHAARLEAQLAEARLDALRMQVNPHFLFNALHAISSMVHKDPHGVRVMVAKLASLLRATLKTAADSAVSLERELEVVELYLDIMRVRFRGRLEVDFDMDPDVLDALVPCLILQPLVENAVKHGIGRSEDAAHVVITAGVEGGDLVLAVLDDGPGLTSALPADDEGIGLRNVRARLAELHGDAASLVVADRPEGGVRAEMRLPLRFDAVPSEAVDRAQPVAAS